MITSYAQATWPDTQIRYVLQSKNLMAFHKFAWDQAIEKYQHELENHAGILTGDDPAVTSDIVTTTWNTATKNIQSAPENLRRWLHEILRVQLFEARQTCSALLKGTEPRGRIETFTGASQGSAIR